MDRMSRRWVVDSTQELTELYWVKAASHARITPEPEQFFVYEHQNWPIGTAGILQASSRSHFRSSMFFLSRAADTFHATGEPGLKANPPRDEQAQACEGRQSRAVGDRAERGHGQGTMVACSTGSDSNHALNLWWMTSPLKPLDHHVDGLPYSSVCKCYGCDIGNLLHIILAVLHHLGTLWAPQLAVGRS